MLYLFKTVYCVKIQALTFAKNCPELKAAPKVRGRGFKERHIRLSDYIRLPYRPGLPGRPGIAVMAAAALLWAVPAAAVINLPAPPPELSDTLKDFRTQEQLQEQRPAADARPELGEETELAEPPVPGDDSSGVMRLTRDYVPGQVIGVPVYGESILRIFDLQGIPWEITTLRVENQGFSAQTTASPSEILIKQTQGASSSTLAVNLNAYPSTLIFTLKPVVLNSGGVDVTTILNFVRVRSALGTEGYIFPEINKVPSPNPGATPTVFDEATFRSVEQTLTDVVLGLRDTLGDAPGAAAESTASGSGSQPAKTGGKQPLPD